MILKSITLAGFKSFAKKTTIDITHNVTGIVGPNGSGKSNVAEGIRFVLGEQSMKSIRSKSMSDLIFKGSDSANALSRASVSIDIDNTSKQYSESVSPDLATFLTYDTITLSREVFSDGGSVYKINNAEVRLKDIQSLLALAGLGNHIHSIISQGEADGILLANPMERKEMIENALGLRVHQIRLRDSERKLKKVEEHTRTLELLRRELAPELSHLRVQMEKINKVEGERSKLQEAYISYFAYEDKQIVTEDKEMANHVTESDALPAYKAKLEELADRERSLTQMPENNKVEKKELEEKRFSLEWELSQLQQEKNNLKRELVQDTRDIVMPYAEHRDVEQKMEKLLDIMNSDDEIDIHAVRIQLHEVYNVIHRHSIHVVDEKVVQDKIDALEEKQKYIQLKADEAREKLANFDTHDDSRFSALREIFTERNEIERKIRDIEHHKATIENRKANLEARKENFTTDLQEAHIFVGASVLQYKTHASVDNYDHVQNRRLIERLKIRIEEIGILDPLTIKNSFEELSSRDELLGTELADLEKTRVSLDTLIHDLQMTIEQDFKKGLEKINFTFNNFFHEIFVGGKASVFVEEFSAEEGEDGEIERPVKELGVDIEINLPNKKTRDINMLSGGEKTLASIALLFALTSITPPPFVVLDETDAALDESNAKKYGKLLRRLAQKSRLLVITHNRETMNQCDVLYGITLAGDGSSRLLSIKFNSE